MGWYREGTISLVKGSKEVIGKGTTFKATVGNTGILVVLGNLLEITRIKGETTLILSEPYAGETATDVTYAIIHNLTNASNYDLMRKIEEFLTDRQTAHDEFVDWNSGPFDGGIEGSGLYPLTDRYGTTSLQPSPDKIQHDINTAIDMNLTGVAKFNGEWSAATGEVPPVPVTPTMDVYNITVAGTINGIDYRIGDTIVWNPLIEQWIKVKKPIVLLSDEVNVIVPDQAASSKAVKTAFDKGTEALDKANTKLDKTAAAVSANKLTTPRTIALTGDLIGSVTFDGSTNVSMNTAFAIAGNDHIHVIPQITGLQPALDTKLNKVDQAVDSDKLNGQLAAFYSPATHSHTLESLDAAATGHTHTLEFLNAAAADHTHTLEFLNAAAADHTHTLEFLNAAAADHTHTLESLDAAATGHTHTLEFLNAAAADHTHTLESLDSAAADHTHTLEFLGAAAASHAHTAVDLPDATVEAKGVVQLSDNTTTGTSLTLAATENAVCRVRKEMKTLGIPSGLISMFGGTVEQIPEGWKICDGVGETSNGIAVPDLRSRFIVGAGETYAGGSTGGAAATRSSAGGSHSHAVSIGGTTLSHSQMPQHRHTPTTGAGNSTFVVFGQALASTPNYPAPRNSELVGWAGNSYSHNHTGSASGGEHTHSVSALPPYYALCFIIKL